MQIDIVVKAKKALKPQSPAARTPSEQEG